jgi:polyisoprenoid-binding protein YceI
MNIITVKKINETNTDNYLITADLTILDQTHSLEFLSSIIIKKGIAMAEGKILIDRAQYGIKYKSKTWYKDLGDRFINDIFYLYFSLVAMENK